MSGFLYTNIGDLLGTPPGSANSSWALGINDAGSVVGFYFDDGGVGWHGYVYAGGNYVILDRPGFALTSATGINNAGNVVGYTADTGSGQDSFFYSGGVYTTIRDPLSVNSLIGIGTIATGINNANQIVGYYEDSTGHVNGFLYSGGVFTTLKDPLATTAPGMVDTAAFGINDKGQIVGTYFALDSSGEEQPHAFLYSNGVYTTLDQPSATGINNAGQIVGGLNDGTGYFYSDGIYTNLSYPFAESTGPSGINNVGQIAGTYYDGSPSDGAPGHAFLATLLSLEPDRAHVQAHGTLSVNAGSGVLANDIPNDVLSVSAVNGNAANVGQPVHGIYGALTLNDDGSYAYNAKGSSLPGDHVGFDTFTYTAKDGPVGTASTDLTVVVVSSTEHYLGGVADTTINGGNFKFNGQVLDGGLGNDVLLAGKQGAVEIGGPNDVLAGSLSAADKFVFHDAFGNNEITNFNPKNDSVWLDHTDLTSLKQLMAEATQVGANVIINDGAGDVLHLDNVHLSALHSSNFHFLV